MKDLFVKSGSKLREATREEIVNSASRFLIDDATGKEITADNAAELFRQAIGGHDREHVIVAFVDVRTRVLSMDVMFTGTIDETPMYHREIARRALQLNAAGVVVAHNHPSSHKAKASDGDQMTTLKLAQALELVGVQLIGAYVVTPTDFAPIDPPSAASPEDLLRHIFGIGS